ncbi:branched-chain amino acid ABC transporter substrate-binding protein, partial [Streptomyces sp. NPDC005047]
MRQRSLIAITAALAAGALTLTACGSRDDDGGSDSGSGGGGTTVVIGVDAPLTGDLSALGLGIKNSVDLAAKTANKDNYVDGVKFEIQALDDQGQPSVGQQNATKLVANDDVLGVVGPLNSSVGESMQKVFDTAKLVEVSPANTNPALTQGVDWQTKQVRPYKSYFRTATTDAIQGPFAAQYVFNDSKKKKVFVIDDKKTYGAGLAATFTDEFKKLGGQVVGTEHINPDTKDFNAVATKVKNSGADVVYYGGEYPQAGPLSKQIKAAGAKIPVVGGDGIYSADFIKLAGATGNGDLATSVGAPVEARVLQRPPNRQHPRHRPPITHHPLRRTQR